MAVVRRTCASEVSAYQTLTRTQEQERVAYRLYNDIIIVWKELRICLIRLLS